MKQKRKPQSAPAKGPDLKKDRTMSYKISESFTGGIGPNSPRPERTPSRPVHPPVHRSRSIHKAPSFEDLYKAMPGRTLGTLQENHPMINIGIDWASDHHDIVLVDEQGHRRQGFRINQDAEGVATLRERLRAIAVEAGGKEHLAIGIETSRLLLVDILLNDGYTVYPLNPKAVTRYRDRYAVSGAKSDDFDAEIIANALRTDRDHFRPLVPDSDLVRELRLLVGDQRRFIRTRTLLSNQLRASLQEYFPTALSFFNDIDAPTALAFLKAHPRPEKVSARKLERLLAKARHPSPKMRAEAIAAALAGAVIPVDEFTVRAKARATVTLVEHLQLLNEQLKDYQREIEELFDRHPDAAIFKSFPGAGPSNGPRLLVEIGDNRDRYADADGLQGEAGTCPVTKASGKSHFVQFRRACRRSFRDTMHQFSFCSMEKSGWAKAFYNTQRDHGRNHATALRALGDKWLKIIYRTWKDRTRYDEKIYLAQRMRHQLKCIPTAA